MSGDRVPIRKLSSEEGRHNVACRKASYLPDTILVEAGLPGPSPTLSSPITLFWFITFFFA